MAPARRAASRGGVLYSRSWAASSALSDAGTFLGSAATSSHSASRDPPPAPKEHSSSLSLLRSHHIARTPCCPLSLGRRRFLPRDRLSTRRIIVRVNQPDLHRSPSFIGVLIRSRAPGSGPGHHAPRLLKRLGGCPHGGDRIFVLRRRAPSCSYREWARCRVRPRRRTRLSPGRSSRFSTATIAAALSSAGRGSAAANMLFSVTQRSHRSRAC